MYKTVKSGAKISSTGTRVEIEEFYFDPTRTSRGYEDSFTGVSSLNTIPVPEWGDANVLVSQALSVFLTRNTHAYGYGFEMTPNDYRRLEQCGYFK